MVDEPTTVVNLLPALSVPVETRVSVEMGVEEPPLPPAPAALKMVDVPTAVVILLLSVVIV